MCRAVLDRFPDLLYSISYTTRPPRKGEQHAVDYHFIDPVEFKRGIEGGKWAEWAQVHGTTFAAAYLPYSRAGREVTHDLADACFGGDQVRARAHVRAHPEVCGD